MIELSQKSLLEWVVYYPSTGKFCWAKTSRKRILGKETGYLDVNGYIIIVILGKNYKAHRLAWLYMTGKWPQDVIDHINGNGADNRWGNLRDVNRKWNLQNLRHATKTNGVGMLGVGRRNGRFFAQIAIDGRKRHLGMFDTPEAAHEAYLSAKRKFHPGCTI